MKAEDPNGAVIRHPCTRKRKVHGGRLQSRGDFAEVCCDGHEKFGSMALGLGDVGIDVYGIRDKWGGKGLHVVVVPNARRAATIGHVYLDFLARYGSKPCCFADYLFFLTI